MPDKLGVLNQNKLKRVDLYKYDKEKVTYAAEENIKNLAYRFAMKLKEPFVLKDLEKDISDLSQEVRAMGLVERVFEDIISTHIDSEGDI